MEKAKPMMSTTFNNGSGKQTASDGGKREQKVGSG